MDNRRGYKRRAIAFCAVVLCVLAVLVGAQRVLANVPVSEPERPVVTDRVADEGMPAEESTEEDFEFVETDDPAPAEEEQAEDESAYQAPAFVMPEGASYVEGVALVSVDPEADPEAVATAIANTPGVVAQEVTTEDVTSGLIEVQVAEGVEVEEAVNNLVTEGERMGMDAQPDYVYYSAEDPTVDDLRSLLEMDDEAITTLGEDELAQDEDTQEVAELGEVAEPSEGEDASYVDLEEAEEESTAAEEPTAATDAEATPQDLMDALAYSINDPKANEQWALKDIGAYDAWELARAEGSVTVAVMDTGYDIAHEDLAKNLLAGYNAYDLSTDVTPVPYATDRYHGTHVLGIVSAIPNNGKGIAGISYNAKLMPIKVFYLKDGRSQTTTSVLLRAYDYVFQHADAQNVRVVNLSVGAPYSQKLKADTRLMEKVQVARDKGIVTVVAAGNSMSGATPPYEQYPGDFDNVVSVMNLMRDHTRSSSSNYNVEGQSAKNITAPGSDILSTIPGDDYSELSGTSMAAPYVAGVLALEFAAKPSLTPDEAVDVLYSTTTDLGDEGWDLEFGFGEVNAFQAVKALTGTKDLGAATISLSQTEFVYDGTEKKPAVTVTLDGNTVSAGNYDVSYLNYVEAGMATVTITGKGAYSGQASAIYRIAGRSIEDATVTLAKESFTYDGYAKRPIVTVTWGGETLKEGLHYTLEYEDNIEVGTAYVLVTGKGNYGGTKQVPFKVVARSISAGEVTVDPKSYVYDGNEKKPAVTLYLDGYELEEGYDYRVSYANNVGPGRATVTLEGIGSYSGKLSASFTIGFTDVPKDHWAYAVVNKAAGLGLMHGYDGSQTGKFGPQDHIKRGQAVVTLWNMAGRPKATAAAKAFSDVDTGAYYYEAVRWASSVRVVNGYAGAKAGTFGPNDDVTREQLACMLANYARHVGKLRVSGSKASYASMKDAASVSSYAVSSLGWCFENELLGGANGKLLPGQGATRAQMAKMVIRLYELLGH